MRTKNIVSHSCHYNWLISFPLNLIKATSVRTTSIIPMMEEDSETFDAMKNIMMKKKTLEQSQIETRAKQLAAKKRQLPTQDEQKKIAEKRAAAVLQVAQGREKLAKLRAQRDELEQSIQSEWDEKITKFKKDSLMKEEEVINALKTKHSEEMKQLVQDIEEQNKADDDELALKLNELDEETRKRISGEKEVVTPKSDSKKSLSLTSTPERQKLNDTSKKDDAPDDKEQNDLYDDLFESPVKAAQTEHTIDESDNELFGDSDEEADKSLSDQKKDELKVRMLLYIAL